MATIINAPQSSSFENRKAIAFINFRLPSKDGRTPQIGSIPLYADNRVQNGLVTAIKEGRQDADSILANLQLNVVLVDEHNSGDVQF